MRLCKEGHVIVDNYIVRNDYGIVVEEGVAVTLNGNVVECNKLTGVYLNEANGEIVYPCLLQQGLSFIHRNNVIKDNKDGNLIEDSNRKLPTVFLTS